MTPGCVLVASMIANLLTTEVAEAQRPPEQPSITPEQLVLAVRIEPSFLYQDLAGALLEHLRAELASSGAVVVPVGTPSPRIPSATLIVGADESSQRDVALQLDYAGSGTSVHHVVHTSTLPPDGAVLAIAIAVDELVGSTAGLARTRTTQEANPTVCRPCAPNPPVRPDWGEVGSVVAGARYGDGTVAIGPDILVRVFVGSRLSLEARLGGREIVPRSAPDGSIEGLAVTGGLGAGLALPARARGQRVGFDISARVEGVWVNVRGAARGSALADSKNSGALGTVAGLVGWLALTERLHLVTFLGWQVAFRDLVATDGNVASVQIFGDGAVAALGLGARF